MGSTWYPPVALSLLLHATVITLLTYKIATSAPDKARVQTINVEMLGKTITQQKKPALLKPLPRLEPAKIEQPTVPEKPQAADDKAEQPSTSSPLPVQPGLNVQPLNKLTRPPAFLHKIEPVYPQAEQRAGSQANVLAEITIDAQGSVLEVKIVNSAGSAFDNAVKEALQKSKFVPGYIGAEAVAVRVLVPFRFNLR